jgi:plastocyanin
MGSASRIALACACGWLLAGGAIAADKAATHTVVMDGVAYQPDALTVKRGDTVVWVNKDPFPHTVTAKGSFDSHDIAAGKSWKYTASKAGEYAYICTLHPNMKGTLKVE